MGYDILLAMSVVSLGPKGKEKTPEETFRELERIMVYEETMRQVREKNRPEHEAIEFNRKLSKVLCCLIVLFISLFPGFLAVFFCRAYFKELMVSSVIEKISVPILFCFSYGATAYLLMRRWFAEIDRNAFNEDMRAAHKAYERLMRADQKELETCKNASAAQKENETRKNGTATRVSETISISLKAGTITICGVLVMFVFTMYNLLPLAGVVGVITGLVGFFTGAPYALRAFIAGLVMLAVKLIVGIIFSNFMDQCGKKRP